MTNTRLADGLNLLAELNLPRREYDVVSPWHRTLWPSRQWLTAPPSPVPALIGSLAVREDGQ